MVRHSNTASELWKALPWKQFRRNLFRLQKRVFKAVQGGDQRKARSLQKLILKSQAARLLAIRQVTQLNAGKKTAGVDGKKSLSFEERFALADLLAKNDSDWQHQSLREIPIPKQDGTTRSSKCQQWRTELGNAWQSTPLNQRTKQPSTREATGLERVARRIMPRSISSTTSAQPAMASRNESSNWILNNACAVTVNTISPTELGEIEEVISKSTN